MNIRHALTRAAVAAAFIGVAVQVNAQATSDPPANEPKRSAGQTVDDSTITAKVKSALIADDQVKGTRINVDTDRGVVSLKGTVATRAEKDKAVSLARRVDGVRDIRDNITVGSASVGGSGEGQR